MCVCVCVWWGGGGGGRGVKKVIQSHKGVSTVTVSHLTEGRLVVKPRATVTMSAGTDLEVEGTVDPVGGMRSGREMCTN